MLNVIVACVLTLLLSGVLFAFGFPRLFGRKDTGLKISTKSVIDMSSQQISENLQNLSPKEEPQPKMEAMCYSSVPPQAIENYICPVCHEKTYYDQSDVSVSYSGLKVCRKMFESIKKPQNFSIALDESTFCSHCSPGAKDHLLKLIVTYNDGSTHVTSLVSLNDLILLKSFFDGSTSYQTPNGSVESVKNKLPRLRTLLGEKIDPENYKR